MAKKPAKREIKFSTARSAETNELVGILEITGLKVPVVSANPADWETIKSGAEFILKALEEEERQAFEASQPDLFAQYDNVHDVPTDEMLDSLEQEARQVLQMVDNTREAKNARVGNC